MRPLKLTMSAFGSYTGKTVVDFTKLGEKGLYLITGDTGSGKTTIFDAITFALFGDPSGDDRTSDMLRSSNADPATPTEVELSFLYRGKEYWIKRNPAYTRPKIRGSGERLEPAAAELHRPDGSIVAKVRDVDAAVVEILGIDQTQFCQIAMLAQGKFRELLRADSKTRTKIFRQLFDTGLFEKLQESLKSEAKKRKEQYDALEAERTAQTRKIDCAAGSPRSEQVARAQSGALPEGEVGELLEALIAEDTQAQTRLAEAIQTLDNQIGAVNQQLGAARPYQERKKSLSTNAASLPAAEQALNGAEQALKKAEAEQAGAGDLAAKIAALDQSLPLYDQLEKAQRERTQLTQRMAQDQATLEETQRKIEASAKEIESLQLELDGLGNPEAEQERQRADKDRATNDQAALSAILQELGELSAARKKLEAAQAAYLRAREKADQMASDHRAKNKAYLNAQAGILAETLTEGQPCPVCGSVHHPAPAAKPTEAPSEEDLKKAQAAMEEAAAAERNASDAAKQKRSDVEHTEALLKKRLEEFGEPALALDDGTEAVVQERLSKKKDELAAITKALAELEKRKARKAALLQQRPERQKKLDGLKASKSGLEKTAAEANGRLQSLANQIDQLRKDLPPYACKKAAENARDALQKQKEDLQAAVDRAREAKNKANMQVASLRLLIEADRKALAGMAAPEVEPELLDQRLEELTGQRAQQQEQQTTAAARRSRNESIQKRLCELQRKLAALLKEKSEIDALSKTANGNLTGNEKKLELETYVQMAYFDRVLQQANRRLMIMTGNQYELRRREEPVSGAKKFGLDLDVYDYFTNTQRNANSISGGEGFVASLALALGLSDVVQASSGGVRIDSLFVDEGFGSLDSDKLDLVMRALAELTEGDRLVGVISHVDTLKSGIDRQIVVKKDRNSGSTIEIKT